MRSRVTRSQLALASSRQLLSARRVMSTSWNSKKDPGRQVSSPPIGPPRGGGGLPSGRSHSGRAAVTSLPSVLRLGTRYVFSVEAEVTSRESHHFKAHRVVHSQRRVARAAVSVQSMSSPRKETRSPLRRHSSPWPPPACACLCAAAPPGPSIRMQPRRM